MDINVLHDLVSAAGAGYISSSKLGEDYILDNFLDTSILHEDLSSAIGLFDICMEKADSKSFAKIFNMAYLSVSGIKNPGTSIVTYLEYYIDSVLKTKPPIKISRAIDSNGSEVFGDIYFFAEDSLPLLKDRLIGVTERLEIMADSGDIDDYIKGLGYSSLDDFMFTFKKIEHEYLRGTFDRFLSLKNFYSVFNISRNRVFDWLSENFFEINYELQFSPAFVIAAFLPKSDVPNIYTKLGEILIKNLADKKSVTNNSISLINSFRKWLKENGTTFFNDGIGKKIYDIINAAKEEAITNENKKIEKITKVYNLDYSFDYLSVEEDSNKNLYYNYFLSSYKSGRYDPSYIQDIGTIINIMNSFLREQYNNFVVNEKLNTDIFFKYFNVYLSNFMTDDQLVYHFSADRLESIKEEFREKAAIHGARKLSALMSEQLYNKLFNNRDFRIAYSFSANKPFDETTSKLSISSFISNDEKRLLLLSSKSKEQVYSFKKSSEVIRRSIKDIKIRSHEFEKIISKDITNQFFDRLEDILIRQLKQEDLFLQGKSNSLGMLDLIRSDLKLNLLDKLMPNSMIANTTDDSFFKAFESFHEQFFNNFNKIFLYFKIFKDEADKFFSNNDINSIKSSILKLLNFLNSKTSNDETMQSIIHKACNLNSKVYIYEEDEYYYTIDIVNNIYKNDKNTTKKEYIQKIENPLQLLHNFSNSSICEKVIKSETFKKTHNINMFQLQNIAIPILNDSIYCDTFNELLNNKKIPTEYITDNIIKFFESSRRIETAQDYDTAINYLIGDGSSESFRKAKFVLGFIQNFSDISDWMESAKPKDPAIFAPNLETEKFRFRVLKDFDPLHFSIGVETDCCQTIGGAGESAAIDSFINPYAGVLLLESKSENEWQLAAQSYFHYAELEGGEKAIILDNIEAGKFEKLHKDDFYREAYATLGSYLIKSGFKVVGCGISYTEVIDLNDFETGSLKSDPRHFEVEEHGRASYTDFDNGSFYDLTKPKFDFKQSENIIENEGELSKLSLNILSLYIEKYGSSIAKKILKTSKLLEKNGFKKEAADTISIAIIK